MCGIFGSTNFHDFEILYSRNKERGNFAHGFYYIKKNGETYVRKGSGEFNLTGEYAWKDTLQYNTYLGHTQAPTSAQRKFKPITSHPFNCGNFVVAHNGVLENHNELSQEYFNEDVVVDSEVIPKLLDYLYVGDDIIAIEEVCNKLKGIFSCWIYSKYSSQTYVIRNGCTLYTDDDMQIFTSVKTNRAKTSLVEGNIYCLSPEGLAISGKFQPSTQFFM
jgi:glucosamine 6-phosphate synthetase-like amidotransferase/phosphosugar isomerase protein